MSRAGRKLLKAAAKAVRVAKCDHDYVEGATVKGRKVLRCIICKVTVHFIDRDLGGIRRKT